MPKQPLAAIIVGAGHRAITYQGDAATKALTGGNDILIWGLLPAVSTPRTLIIIQ